MKEKHFLIIIVTVFLITQIQFFTLKNMITTNREVITETVQTLEDVAEYAASKEVLTETILTLQAVADYIFE